MAPTGVRTAFDSTCNAWLNSVARGAERHPEAAGRGFSSRKGVFADHGEAIAHQMRQQVGAVEMLRQGHPEMVARRPRRVGHALEEARRKLLAGSRLVADGTDDVGGNPRA